MPVVVQTVAGGLDFDGTAGAGLFEFSNLVRIAETSRVVINGIALHVDAGGPPPLDDVIVFLEPPDGSTRWLLDRSTGADITGPDNEADLVLCGRVVPRAVDGTHWQLKVITTNKLTAGQASVDFQVHPFPAASGEDGPPA